MPVLCYPFNISTFLFILFRGKWDYELYLRYDLFTSKHTQWFFFAVRNMKQGQTYRFTIVNFYKSGSLYNMGMKPLMYSDKQAKLKGIGWRRVGFNIKYFKTDIRYIIMCYRMAVNFGGKNIWSIVQIMAFGNFTDKTVVLLRCSLVVIHNTG